MDELDWSLFAIFEAPDGLPALFELETEGEPWLEAAPLLAPGVMVEADPAEDPDIPELD